VAVGHERTVLFFLTSSCYGCQVIWQGFGGRSQAVPAESDEDRDRRRADASSSAPTGKERSIRDGEPTAVLVTPSPTTESAKQVAALAPAGIEVLMSSEAWHAYGVTSAPWYLVVVGGVVVAEGPAPGSWRKVEALLRSGA
jgi:hypothetical protein